MKILAFAASLRRDSLNRRLLDLAAGIARDAGADVDVAHFREFDMPLYDDDVKEVAFPPGADEMRRRVEAADGLMIASPEYNYSVPGTLKNAVDWLSRYRPRQPFGGKTGVLLSASPSAVGGIRGLWALRIPLEGLGVTLHPDMFALAQADRAFGGDGGLADAALQRRLESLVAGYLRMGERLRE